MSKINNNNNNNNKEKILNSKLEIKLDIINAFGADTQSDLGQPINFITKNNYILYKVGHVIMIREITMDDNNDRKLISIASQSKQNNLQFIYLEKNSKKITSMTISNEKSVFILCEETEENYGTISLFYLAKINFNNVIIHEPKRKIITDKYYNFRSVSISHNGNYIICICTEKETNKKKGIIYDVQLFQKFKLNLTKPAIVFDINQNANKISFHKKIICSSGNLHINFYKIFDNNTKEIKNNLIQNKNYVDHCFIIGSAVPLIITITSKNELFVIEGVFEQNNKNYQKNNEKIIFDKIDFFIIKQYISNIFHNENSQPTKILSLKEGLIIGNNKGDLLFLENNHNYININNEDQLEQNSKNKSNIKKYYIKSPKNIFDIPIPNENFYSIINTIHRDLNSSLTGISSNFQESMFVFSYENNEIAYCECKNIFNKIKTNSYEIEFNILCEGFHHGSINSFNMSIQRPILVSASKEDKSIRIWNYITGHSEYCRLIFSENYEHKLKNFQINSLAIHPNGLYLAIADYDTIWFFFICYKELRFYGTDYVEPNEDKKINCYILKFSNNGHLIVACNERFLFVIESLQRKTLKQINLPISDLIQEVFFSEDDKYLYTIGLDGNVFQVDLNSFDYEKIFNKNVQFLNGFYYSSNNILEYEKEINKEIENKKLSNLILIGIDLNKNYTIIEATFIPKTKYLTEYLKIYNISEINTKDKINTVNFIKSKKFGMNCIFSGTKDGKIVVYPSPFKSAKFKYDEIKSHNENVNEIIFNNDLNILFSCGNDGNIFVYSIYENFENDEANFNKKITNLNQLNTVLDASLGEIVLFPMNKLENYENLKNEKKNILLKFEDEKEKIEKDYKKKIEEIINDLNKKKEEEIKKLNNKIFDLNIKNKEIVEEYEKNIKEIIEKNRKKTNEQNKLNQENINNLQLEISKLENEIIYINENNDFNLKKKTKEFREKFHLLEKTLKSKLENYIENNNKLSKDLENFKKEKLSEIKIIEIENEIEKNLFLKNQDENNENYQFKIEEQNLEIIRLKDIIKKLEDSLNEKTKENIFLNEKCENFQNVISIIKNNLNHVSIEKENLIKKITELEKNIQQKEILSGYSNSLKNELYKKNTELTKFFKQIQQNNNDLIINNQNLEKNIEKSITKIFDSEHQKKKQEIYIKSIKNDINDYIKKYNEIKNILDNILIKLYDSFLTNNKNNVYRAVCEIYKKFITNEFLNEVQNKKLNVDIKDELENQIDLLQNNLNITNEHSKNIEKLTQYFKEQKMKENSCLIENFNVVNKKNIDYNNEIKHLKFNNRQLNDKINDLNNKKNFSTNNINNNFNKNNHQNNFKSSITNLPKLLKNFSAENINNNIKNSSVETNEINYKKNLLKNVSNFNSNKINKIKLKNNNYSNYNNDVNEIDENEIIKSITKNYKNKEKSEKKYLIKKKELKNYSNYIKNSYTQSINSKSNRTDNESFSLIEVKKI